MSKLTLIKLTNLSPLHIGIGRDSYDVTNTLLRSDTLSAALAALRAARGHDSDISSFLQCFALSSAFPYYGETYFLPKPAGRLQATLDDGDEMLNRKKLKKVAWVEHSLWQSLTAGEMLSVSKEQLQGEYLIKKGSKFESPMQVANTQRVQVPRDGKDDTQPFNFAWMFFRPKAGLYCLLDAPEDMKDEIIDLFKDLGEHGIGSDRSVGGGHFDVVAEEFSISYISAPNAVMTLSMLIPTSDELKQIDLEHSQFSVLKRGGFMAGTTVNELRHMRKNTIYMFTEGSVFATTNNLKGKVVDLTPNVATHPVYRSGRAICVTIKTNQNG